MAAQVFGVRDALPGLHRGVSGVVEVDVLASGLHGRIIHYEVHFRDHVRARQGDGCLAVVVCSCSMRICLN